MEKNNPQQYWQRFETTGNIADYLSYKQLESSAQKQQDTQQKPVPPPEGFR